MGNTACCSTKDSDLDKLATSQGAQLAASEAVAVNSDRGLGDTRAAAGGDDVVPVLEYAIYKVVLDKAKQMKLGLDVDFMAERMSLPVMQLTGGLAEDWNKSNPIELQIKKGDSIVEVNGISGNVGAMLDKCRSDALLNLTISRAMTYDHLIADVENLINKKQCGPILIRLSWHDAGVFVTGKGGCPNAAMRFTDGGEGKFAANAGLPTVALKLLGPITQKYCPHLLSQADMWALTANVSIRVMGGPDIPTRFGRTDAKSHNEGVSSQEGRLLDGDKGVDHLRAVFHAKGFNDKQIVALSGAHTVGRCHLDRSGFDGPWTEDPLKFNNTYFKELLSKSFTSETTAKGCPQHRHAATGTMMLVSDMALLQDPAFKVHVQSYADDQAAFFSDFSKAWMKLQELGVEGILRDTL